MSSRTVGEQLSTADDVRNADLSYLVSSLESEFQEMSGSRMLITGGAGFLGFYLVQAVLHWNDVKPGQKVDLVVVDNFIRGVPDWLGVLDGRPDVKLTRWDITQRLPDEVEGFDYVIHAAGIASPTFYRAHPIQTMDANVNGLRTLLDMAHTSAGSGRPMRGFLYFSSSEIYGDPSPDAIPTPETYRGLVSCTGPRACYDESKRFGETLCVSFAQTLGVPTRIARPFNNYGPGMSINDGRVIADFCKAVIEDRDIVMYSDGSPTRTFCYVADAVTGYFKALVRGGDGEPYNIGVESPEISMSDFADLVASTGSELFGYSGSVVKKVNPEDDYLVDNPSRRSPRIEKARTELGYAPQFSLEDGIRRTLLWYSRHRQDGA
jgi:dTDP-glucose 4,6-dehydratase/UDP-glucuronate decarboxylase